MVLLMTIEYLYCKATGQEMEERKRWFQFWKDDIKEKEEEEEEEDTDDDNNSTSSAESTTEDRESSYESTDYDNNTRLITLNLPSGSDKKLGIAFHDDKQTKMTELAYVYPSSPVYDQISTELHKGWYVKSIESSSIGKVQPKDADECVDCINRARKAKDTKLEMTLIKASTSDRRSVLHIKGYSMNVKSTL